MHWDIASNPTRIFHQYKATGPYAMLCQDLSRKKREYHDVLHVLGV